MNIEDQCHKLIEAFEERIRQPFGSHGRNRPLTPNDPATIARLAQEVLDWKARFEATDKVIEAARAIVLYTKDIESPEQGNLIAGLKADLEKCDEQIRETA